jgi:hypothetical protein
MAQLTVMENRATEVLKEASRCGWEDYQYICEDAAEAARHLWHKCEELLSAVGVISRKSGPKLYYISEFQTEL